MKEKWKGKTGETRCWAGRLRVSCYGRELHLDTQSSSESKSPHILCCSQPRPLKLPSAFPKVSNLDFQAFNIVVNNTLEFSNEQLKELSSPDKRSQHYRSKASLSTDRKESYTYKMQGMNTHLSNWHSTENIQEDEGAVCGVIAQQVSMRQSLDVRKRGERELCHHSTIKSKMEK